MSTVYLYAKNKSDAVEFDQILQFMELDRRAARVTVTIENERSFRQLERIKQKLETDDIVVVKELRSLGVNPADVCAQLKWFSDMSQLLIVQSFASTYSVDISQPLNKAVIRTIMEGYKQTYNISSIQQRRISTVRGRSKILYPANWEELYKQWEAHEISSHAFIDATGLKKATFYNLITEYREQQRENRELQHMHIA